LLWALSENFQLGAAYSNLGTNVVGYSLAQSLQLGGAWRTKAAKNLGLLLTMQGNWQPQGISLLQWGVEGNLDHAFMLRGGYELPFDGQITGGGTALSAGAGVRWGACTLDYAFVPYGSFGVANHLSLSYDFPVPQPQVVQVPVTIIQKVIVQAPAPTPAPVAADSKSLVQMKFKIPADEAAQEGSSFSASQLDAQIQTALQSVKSDPQNSRFWWKLGYLYYQSHQKDSALQCFDQVLRLSPDNADLKKWVESYRSAQP
jgi:tetratricopeptide (TPR) repeat protein